MPVAPPAKLGPYEILEPLGAGGMGEVYRARDTRLDRTVAIKILPQHLSSDPLRKQRFEREAKVISSLNHPHICTLYDIGQQDGVAYLVMECIEGETLSKRLEKGPLPLEQVIKYGAQIADALDKAHRCGIVHRDLKPGNVMLTSTGAKLLDFGLARPVVSLSSATTIAVAPSSPVTAEGIIIGTFQYMSPEQLEGKELDGRSDIFSLGAVLYEMLTGKRAFEGKTQLSVASAILEKEPAAICSVKPMTPPALDHAIRRCLAKDREERWQTARDLAFELKWTMGSHIGSAFPISAPGGTIVRGRAGWIFAATAALTAVVLAFAYFHKIPADARVIRSVIPAPNGGAFIFDGPVGGAMLSPDGKSVAFIARAGTVTQIWLRSLDSFSAHAVAGTEDASFVFWSPDSRHLGFFVQGKLKRVAVAGGPLQTLCDTESNRGASWGSRDVIIFSRSAGEILSIPASGGTPQRVTTLDASRHEGTHRWPFFLPDGNHFLFMAALLGPVTEDNVFYVGSLDGTPSKVLFHGSSPIAYSRGHVLYILGNVLMARPFNLVKLEPEGDAVPLAEGIQFDPQFSSGIFSASENGTLLYQLGVGGRSHSLQVRGRNGQHIGNLGEAAPGTTLRASPDGKNLAYDTISASEGKIDLWVLHLDSGSRTRLASDPMPLGFHNAVWSPDGRRIAYFSSKAGTRALYISAVNEVAKEEERWESSNDIFATASDWTPDANFLILTERPLPTGEQRISVLSVLGKSGPQPLIEMKGARVDGGQVSPDGRWIAYRSDESGKSEIYVSPFPKPVGKLQVSIGGGVQPRWRHDGRELYYLAFDRKMMAVAVSKTEASFQPGSVRPLFEMFRTMWLTVAGQNQYEVMPDGNKFIAVSSDSDESPAPLSLVQNWTADLKQK
jgi:Tol biopolymer transport system component